MPVNTVPEKSVVEMWQVCLPGRTDLVTEDGEPIRIIYPGRINHDSGADFLDAVIANRRGLIKGDVEVHVKSSSWRAHGHHQDPAYNRVVLHVVCWHDAETAAGLQNGRKVPTLALHKFVENQADRHTTITYPATGRSMPCRNSPISRNINAMGEILDSAGEERFLAKVTGFRTALARTETSQCLYQGIMEALGYVKNKHPLAELSRRMPLCRLESVAFNNLSDAECLAWQQALLMGMAGLLPSQRSSQYQKGDPADEWVEKLERLWASSRETATMSENDWHFCKVRPSNLPTRRIAAMSYLLLRYRERGILTGLVGSLSQAAVDASYGDLESSLRVTTNGYWAKFLDFGLPGRRGRPALLGRGRAADIVVNILLPFAVAWGQVGSHPELVQKAFELYRNYPVLDVNALEKHMIYQLGISRYAVNSARRQQGLIHIYRTMCSQGRCGDCPIGCE